MTLVATDALMFASDVPKLKANVGLPVIDELMGGCSLTCSFPWSVAEGGSTSKITALNDSTSSTAWTQAKIGERLTFRLPENLPRELNGAPFYGVEIANGRITEFREYGRIKTIVLYHNDRAIYEIQWADTWRWQKAERG